MTFIPQPTTPPQHWAVSLSLPVPSGDSPAQLWPAPPGPWWPSSPSQPPPPPPSIEQSLSLYLCLLVILQHSCGLHCQVLELHPPANNPPPPQPKASCSLSLSLPAPSGDPPAQPWPAPPGPWRASSPSQQPPPHPCQPKRPAVSLSTCAFWWSSSTAVACSYRSLMTFIPQPTAPPPPPSGDPPAQPWPAPTGPWWPSSLSQLPPPPPPSGDPPAQPWPAPTGPWWPSSLSQLPPPPPPFWWSSSTAVACSYRSLMTFIPQPTAPPPPLLVILQHSRGLLLQVLDDLHPSANCPPPPPPALCSLSLSTCAFWWSSSTAVACSSKSLKSFIRLSDLVLLSAISSSRLFTFSSAFFRFLRHQTGKQQHG